MRASEVTDVGAGIVGASVAYHAARRGAAVVLLDRSLPASGATGDSFAWIGGAARKDAEEIARLEPNLRTPPRAVLRSAGLLTRAT